MEYVTGVVALAIVVLSAYMMYYFQKYGIVPIIEEPKLFTIQFMVVSFTELCDELTNTSGLQSSARFQHDFMISWFRFTENII